MIISFFIVLVYHKITINQFARKIKQAIAAENITVAYSLLLKAIKMHPRAKIFTELYTQFESLFPE
jgi:hypothetical protein